MPQSPIPHAPFPPSPTQRFISARMDHRYRPGCRAAWMEKAPIVSKTFIRLASCRPFDHSIWRLAWMCGRAAYASGSVRSRKAHDAWLPCTRNIFQMVKIQALCLQLMLVTASSQFRRISCSPLEVYDLHNSWAAVSTGGPFFSPSLMLQSRSGGPDPRTSFGPSW